MQECNWLRVAVMKSIIFKIRERVEQCKSSGDMFTMPDIDGCTVSNQGLPCAGSAICHSVYTVSLPDGRSILIDYQSKDKSKTFSVVPDRSCIRVECSDHSNDFSDAWDEEPQRK